MKLKARSEMQSKISAFFKPSLSPRPESPESSSSSAEEPEIDVSCKQAGSEPEGKSCRLFIYCLDCLGIGEVNELSVADLCRRRWKI
ncbi:hypothetical protein C2S53_013346 [Perilla frutescens var. hirtella]|uniref:Uncharacterized protein n=1 Tax=Perilla frutescens var. hirtella TaxID=608512 RepID=A0AAD4PFN6_PERFH|nr:hypothetical protein C2S53_013346 [Perilla frutescens var. hirtella]